MAMNFARMEHRHPTSPHPKKRWRVAVVDDYSIIRAVYKSLVDDDPELSLIWSASCLAEARNHLARHVPDLLILDVSLPDGNGIDFAREVLGGLPELRVLIVSSHEGIAQAEAALASGAKGYVAKSSSPEDLVAAIDVIRKGGTCFRKRSARKQSSGPPSA